MRVGSCHSWQQNFIICESGGMLVRQTQIYDCKQNPGVPYLRGMVASHGGSVSCSSSCSTGNLAASGTMSRKHAGYFPTSLSPTADSNAKTGRQLCEEEQLREAVEDLDLVVQQGSYVEKTLIYRLLKRCMAQKDLLLGRRVHVLTVQSGYESDAYCANHIIRMYATHGRLLEARQVFTKVANPDCYMWSSIISAHTEHGQPTRAISLYRQMRLSAVKPNSYVFVAALNACASAEDFAAGKEVHDDFLQSGVEHNDVYVGNSLVDMYAKCGSLDNARRVFDRLQIRDVVTWNAMIGGYAHHGHGEEALALYTRMQREGSVSATPVTFVCVLQACASLRALDEGKQLHTQVQQRGLEGDVVVGSCLVDMYAKCGSFHEAQKVFDRLSSRNLVTWTAMISGYAQHGLGQEALALYASMRQERIVLTDYVLFVTLLQACGSVGALQQGKQIHEQIKQRGLDSNVVVGSSLVDMYAKCGNVKVARTVFDSLPRKNVVTWTALLNGYAGHGEGRHAIECFAEMQQQGIVPDSFTFSCLLVACSHEGLVNEGQGYFKMMVEDYGIVPTDYHYSCMVDLLGRSGRLEEAEEILQTMPNESGVVGLTSLLSCCNSHGDIDLGRRCFDRLVELEPENSAAYVLLGNIYANAGRWRDVDRIEGLRKYAGAWKKPGKACIEVKEKVHEFTVGEERTDISSGLRSMNLGLKEEGGHLPQTELVLKAVSDREKEDALCGHAEKLALAYGLMNTPDGTALLVTKNLRMCNDCHSSTKILSRLEKREIVVRDAHRVHRFLNGSCSCGDRH